jgi:glycosyltransferase involved in cell wall biosynthesis
VSFTIALVPAFNGGSYLRPSVESLLAQTRIPDRIIVIDDASTDDSISTIKDFEESGAIEIRRNECNLGKAESLNRCFDEIEADYFLIQDADDIALPHRLEIQVAFMDEDVRVGCSSGFIEYISKTGRKIGTGKLDLLTKERLAEYLAGIEPFGLFCPATIIRASVVRDSRLRFRGEFWPADDIDLWNRIAEAGWMVLAQPETIVQYRVHQSSAVTRSYKAARMQFEWVRSCLRARRIGATEPTHSEFVHSWQSAPLLSRIRHARTISAKALYRGAGFSVADGRYARATVQAAGSFALKPSYFLRRLIQQAGRRHDWPS